MPLRDTSRSVDDMLYSLGTALQRFKGENGLKRFLDAGKLSLLSFVGDFQETRDELFARRTYSLSNTRKCLMTLNDLFEDVTRYATKMTDKFDLIAKTLDKFHRCCDLELENPEDTDNTDYIVAEEKLRDMSKLNSEMKSILDDFCNSASTCKSLNASTVGQLEEVDTETAGAVGKAQTDFDAQRRRVQVKEDEIARLRSSGTRPSQDQIQFAEFNLQYESESLQTAGDRYFFALREAMDSTSFALEQTCMATWASSNVFFVQYATFLREFEHRVSASAKVLMDIKNSQTVSKQIGVERKAMLDALHPKPPMTAPPGAPAATPAARMSNARFDELENLFGPSVAPASAAADAAPGPLPSSRAAAQGVPEPARAGGREGPQPFGRFPEQVPNPHHQQAAPQLPNQPQQWVTQQGPAMPLYGPAAQVLPTGYPQQQTLHPPPQQYAEQRMQPFPAQQIGAVNNTNAHIVSGYHQFQQQQQPQEQYNATQATRLPPPHATTQQPSSSMNFDDLFH